MHITHILLFYSLDFLTRFWCNADPFLSLWSSPFLLLCLYLGLYAFLYHGTCYEFFGDLSFHCFGCKNVGEVVSVT